jgi:nicotinic acid phosphoribosyltransferase
MLSHAGLMKTEQIDPSELDAYDAWVAEHLDEMVRQHPGKVIAVYQGRLIAVADSYREAFEAAKAQGIAGEPFTMRVPTGDEANAVFPSVFPARGA